MNEIHVWWWIVLNSTACFTTLLVRILAWKERWVGSSWVIVYLGCSLMIGVLWISTLR
jgi:hypothetical protein